MVYKSVFHTRMYGYDLLNGKTHDTHATLRKFDQIAHYDHLDAASEMWKNPKRPIECFSYSSPCKLAPP